MNVRRFRQSLGCGLILALLAPAAGAVVPPSPGAFEAPARPGWTFLALSDDTLVYVKDAPASGAIRKVWTLYDLPTKRERDGVIIMSVASLGEYDCAEMTSRTVEEAYHEQPGLAGVAHVRPPIEPTGWERPSRGSIGAMKIDFACRPEL